jgi:two-component system cell cycle sensor histidine kinase/response regulator CckA
VEILRKKEIISLVAGGVAHDFNNSLQAIKGFAELVLDRSNTDALPKDVVELQSQILKSSGSAADLVKKLLALSSQRESLVARLRADGK